MASPKLHTTTLQIHDKAPGRAHAELLKTILRAIEELSQSGMVMKETNELGISVWSAKGAKGLTVVAEEYTYVDSVQRTQKALRLSSWLCLALTLKVTRENTRQAFADVVLKHPVC